MMDDGASPRTAPPASQAPQRKSRLPEVVGLCPHPGHTEEFYMPHGGGCPLPGCGETLVLYRTSGASGLDEDELRILLRALLKTAFVDAPSSALYSKLSAELVGACARPDTAAPAPSELGPAASNPKEQSGV